ncbi:MAG: hypothetical protein U9O64_05930 [Campylobacterota bacterium]|nr:hypothetical protein [Campylobacterota bacterium]
MTNLKNIALSAAVIAAISGCGDTTVNQTPSNVIIDNSVTDSNNVTSTTTDPTDPTDPTNPTNPEVEDLIEAAASLPRESLVGNLSENITLTADKLWVLDGLVVVESGATLTIEPGTVIAGTSGTGDATSYMIVDKSGTIIADAKDAAPIVFTSVERVENIDSNDVGQWGGLTLIGHAGNDQVNPYEVNTAFEADDTNLADSSGTLRNIHILNSGITMAEDKEINGLSFVGVGSGTIVEDIIVDYSDDDGIEIWGGTVNLTNVTITNCTDDYFDIDDGYAGTVKNLVINTTTGNAGIEMSGVTAATFDGFSITTGATQDKEGGIFFKKDGIGGHFKNGTIVHNGGLITPDGAIHSQGIADIANVSFENVSITAPDNLLFTGDSADALETKFYEGTGNSTGCTIPDTTTLAGDLTGCTILTADKIWELSGLVVVTPGAQLRILEGTTVVGLPGTGDSTSYMIVDKGAEIFALGTEANPIIFTSEERDAQEVGLWGGLTLIGHAGNDQVNPYEVNTAFEADDTDLEDSSGILRHVKILNSGITMAEDKEINGLSFVGVGSGTIVEDITVDYSDDDGIEIWGGTVNLTNVKITNCTDDYFDIDDGYAGTVKNLVINTTTGNAGIEMSGVTAATFDGFEITTGVTQDKEGGIFFKKDGIGGHFKNGTIVHNGGLITPDGAIHTQGIADIANISFEDVAITTGVDLDFTGDSADALEATFNAGTGNSVTFN